MTKGKGNQWLRNYTIRKGFLYLYPTKWSYPPSTRITPSPYPPSIRYTHSFIVSSGYPSNMGHPSWLKVWFGTCSHPDRLVSISPKCVTKAAKFNSVHIELNFATIGLHTPDQKCVTKAAKINHIHSPLNFPSYLLHTPKAVSIEGRKLNNYDHPTYKFALILLRAILLRILRNQKPP